MGICSRHFVINATLISKVNFNSPTKCFCVRYFRMISLGPFRVFAGGNGTPESPGARAASAFPRVTVGVVPAAIFKRHCKDIHYGVIQGLATGPRIQFLRIVGAAPDNPMGVLARMDN